jgi:hypothetical protein
MQATMTCVGLDVHARSTHAAVIDAVSGECAVFGSAVTAAMLWIGWRGWPRRCGR